MCEESGELIGRIAMSRAGRDKDRVFIITGVPEENYVLLVDGCLRKLGRPKKKKRKHIRLEPACVESVKGKLLEGKQVFDAEIRNCLINLGYKLD